MVHRSALAALAFLISLTAVGMAATPTEAFSEDRFIDMHNANMGVIDRGFERLVSGQGTNRQFERWSRELARAINREVTWLREHRATPCQRQFVPRMILRGVEARKAFKAAARNYDRGTWRIGNRHLDRGWAWTIGHQRVAMRMIETCP